MEVFFLLFKLSFQAFTFLTFVLRLAKCYSWFAALPSICFPADMFFICLWLKKRSSGSLNRLPLPGSDDYYFMLEPVVFEPLDEAASTSLALCDNPGV